MKASGHPSRRRNRSRETVLRVAARSIERRRARNHRLAVVLMWVLGTPAVLAALGWGVYVGWQRLFVGNSFFNIQQVEVRTDGSLSGELVREYAEVREGMNLFEVSPAKISERLMSVPVVEEARVGRRFPSTLVIELKERVAVARLGRPGAGSPLATDATGHVLGPSSVRPQLPVVTGLSDIGLRPGDVVKDSLMADALKVLEICGRPGLRRELRVVSIEANGDDGLTVGLATGEQVLFSRGKLEEKLAQLPVMREAARKRNLGLAVYDMTVDRNYAGRPAGPEASAREER